MKRYLVAALIAVCAAGPALAQDLGKMIERVDPGVGFIGVRVQVDGEQFTGNGTGTVIHYIEDSLDFYMLTNHHVIDGANEIRAFFGVDGANVDYAAEVVHASKDLDLAVIRVERNSDQHQPPVIAIAVREIAKAETVAAIGFPGIASALDVSSTEVFISTFTQGTVSRVVNAPWGEGTRSLEIVQHTATINPGNSGGPLLDVCGQIVGVNTQGAKAEAAHSTFWSSSSNTVARYLDQQGIPYLTAASSCGGGGVLSAGSPLMLALFGLAGAGLLATGGVVWSRRRVPVPAGGDAAAPPPPSTAARSDDRPTAALVIRVEEPGGVSSKYALTEQQLRNGVTIGRGDEAAIQLKVGKVSRRHARLSIAGRKLMLVDLGSTNGTEVDGEPLAAETPRQINTRSEIRVGDVTLKLERPTA